MDIVKIYELFPDQESCIQHLESVRWHGVPVCPYCKSDKQTPAPSEQRYHCNNCKTSFSVTVGTIFHHTHLPLQKWFLAVTLMLNAKKGLSSRQMARDLHVHKDTAWRITMKIREAMRDAEHARLLQGVVEVDETYIGGKPRKGDGEHHKRGRGTDKTPVVGMIERGGRMKAKVVKKGDLKAHKLSMLVRRTVDIKNCTLMTDEFKGYCGIKLFMPHFTINHQISYSDGEIHTNNAESFWALLKRGIIGQYHKVSVRYLPKYLDEFCYRFNHRKSENLFGLTIAKGLGVSL